MCVCVCVCIKSRGQFNAQGYVLMEEKSVCGWGKVGVVWGTALVPG